MCRSWGATQGAVRTAIQIPTSGENRYINITGDTLLQFVHVVRSRNVRSLKIFATYVDSRIRNVRSPRSFATYVCSWIRNVRSPRSFATYVGSRIRNVHSLKRFATRRTSAQGFVTFAHSEVSRRTSVQTFAARVFVKFLNTRLFRKLYV